MQGGSNLVLDTSSLIIFAKINELDLVRRMGEKIFVTPAVHKEYGKELPQWITVSSPSKSQYQKILKGTWMKVRLVQLLSL